MLLTAFIRRAPLLILCRRHLPSLYRTASRSPGILLRQCSSHSKQHGSKSNQTNDHLDKVKLRRAYALGGCLVFLWLSLHALLLYRRRNEYRSLNEKLPPISWEDFVDRYLLPGLVKTIIYQPHFEVGNVYLHSATEKLMKKAFLDLIHTAPDKFSRPPDVRFSFQGKGSDVEKAILELQKATHDSASPLKPVEFEIDQFPSHRELAFIVISTLFTIAAVTLVK